MPRDLASALQEALSDREFPAMPDVRVEGRSVFMSNTRRRLFQYLTDMPAASLREMERALNLTIPSLKWHIDRLKHFSVVMEEPYKNLNISYPAGLITPFEARVLSSMRNRIVRESMELIAANPGIDAPALCRSINTYPQQIHIATRKLLSLGLISSEKIGRERRFFPEEEFLSQVRAPPREDYILWLFNWLENDAMLVSGVRVENGYGIIDIELPERKTGAIRVNLLPYRNLIHLKN